MTYRLEMLERFAMQAEEIIQQLPTFGGSVDADTVGQRLGLSPTDSRNIGHYLREIGWATFSEPSLVLLPKGFEEIAKLRRPQWRRWIDRHPMINYFFWTLITGLIGGIIGGVIVGYFLK